MDRSLPRILFYHPTSRSDGYPEPPLGLGYLMSIAKKLDFEYDLYDEDHHRKFILLDDVLAERAPDVLAISFMTPQISDAKKAIEHIKNKIPSIRIIAGGAHATALPHETLKEIEQVDFLCKGEGELVFSDFLHYLKDQMPLESIAGLHYRRNGEIVSNEPRELIGEQMLEEYSIDWEKLFHYGPYRQKLSYRDEIHPVFPVITARGCPFSCTFCDEGNIWQRKVRMRSIENVAGEIRYLIDTYKSRIFNILDDTFTLKKARLLEFCSQVSSLNIRFRITARVNTIDEEILSALKGAGCELIAYGVESGDDEVLKGMKKQQTVEQIENAFRLTRQAGIYSFALCMVGNLNEDYRAVKKTCDLIKRIRPDLFSCAIMIPYPGSENYRICEKNGWILNHDWQQWVPSLLKTDNYRPVAKTGAMDERQIMKAYYFMNRLVLQRRFAFKYGRFFILNRQFYLNELYPRIKTLGLNTFLRHLKNLYSGESA